MYIFLLFQLLIIFKTLSIFLFQFDSIVDASFSTEKQTNNFFLHNHSVSTILRCSSKNMCGCSLLMEEQLIFVGFSFIPLTVLKASIIFRADSNSRSSFKNNEVSFAYRKIFFYVNIFCLEQIYLKFHYYFVNLQKIMLLQAELSMSLNSNPVSLLFNKKKRRKPVVVPDTTPSIF